MYCDHCGCNIPDDSKYCPNCGHETYLGGGALKAKTVWGTVVGSVFITIALLILTGAILAWLIYYTNPDYFFEQADRIQAWFAVMAPVTT